LIYGIFTKLVRRMTRDTFDPKKGLPSFGKPPATMGTVRKLMMVIG
jgi:hypothetical protein